MEQSAFLQLQHLLLSPWADYTNELQNFRCVGGACGLASVYVPEFKIFSCRMKYSVKDDEMHHSELLTYPPLKILRATREVYVYLQERFVGRLQS